MACGLESIWRIAGAPVHTNPLVNKALNNPQMNEKMELIQIVKDSPERNSLNLTPGRLFCLFLPGITQIIYPMLTPRLYFITLWHACDIDP